MGAGVDAGELGWKPWAGRAGASAQAGQGRPPNERPRGKDKFWVEVPRLTDYYRLAYNSLWIRVQCSSRTRRWSRLSSEAATRSRTTTTTTGHTARHRRAQTTTTNKSKRASLQDGNRHRLLHQHSCLYRPSHLLGSKTSISRTRSRRPTRSRLKAQATSRTRRTRTCSIKARSIRARLRRRSPNLAATCDPVQTTQTMTTPAGGGEEDFGDSATTRAAFAQSTSPDIGDPTTNEAALRQ